MRNLKLYARRGRIAITAAAATLAASVAALTAVMLSQDPSRLLGLQQVAALVVAIAMGWQLRMRLRPVIELSDRRLELSGLASFRPRSLDLSQVRSVADETRSVHRIWDTLCVDLGSRDIVRIHLSELEHDDRARVRAALHEASGS